MTRHPIQFDTSMSDLEVGDIIVSGISAHAPNGFLRKVFSDEIVNGQTVVETTNATLQFLRKFCANDRRKSVAFHVIA